MKTVTYLGPSDYFVARDGGEKIKLPAGTPVEVSEEVASSLAEAYGHDFDIEGASTADEPSLDRDADLESDPDDENADETGPFGSTN